VPILFEGNLSLYRPYARSKKALPQGVQGATALSSTHLAGATQVVGSKEVEEGIWLASFMEYDLGYIDLEEKTLQPLDNPFGSKVLPM
jgi:hypothetical protein